MDADEPVDNPNVAEVLQSPASPDSGEITYSVRFSRFLSGARQRNAFDMARRGEIVLSHDSVVVRGFRREMLFFGTRIEFSLSQADITDVLQLAEFVSMKFAPPGQRAQTLQFWAENEYDAKRIAHALPKTLSVEGIALKEYQTQLGSLNRGDLATKGLVAANVLVFGAAGLAGAGFFVPNVEVLQAWGTNIGPLTTDGQWWRLVSSMFLHFGVFHLALNMWALYIGGRLAERIFGSGAFALIYFAAGIGGSLSSLLWNPAVNSAGASGAIFGVYGAMLAYFLRKHTAIPASVISQQRWSGIVFIGYNLMNGFSHAGIDNADHVGGLAMGFILGLVLARPIGSEARAQVNVATFYLRGTIAALILIGLLAVSIRFSPAGNVPEQRFRRHIIEMQVPEKQALNFAKDAYERMQKHEITSTEFADQIGSYVLPRLELIKRAFERDSLPDDSKLKPLLELLNDYSQNRLEAYRLFASGVRNNRSGEIKEAQMKMDKSGIDLKLMKDFNQQHQ
jgi:rhomboid protease GluP